MRAGATLRTGVTVTGWAGPLTVDTTAPTGLERITARAVVLATGARERSRSARLVPGSRPPGVYTTGELQQAVHLYRQRIGSHAVVIGDEPISHAAADTLRVAGLEVVAMVTDRAPARLAALTRGGDRAPVLGRTTVTALTGRERLTGVSVRHHDGRTATLRCDTVVFTGDWIPEHELARRAGVALDPGTRGPAYDAAHRTSEAGVFAVGNLLHGVESAGVALAEGRAVAAPVLRHLATGEWPTGRPSVAVDPAAMDRAESGRPRRPTPARRPLHPAHHPRARLAAARRPPGRPGAPPAAAAAAGRAGPPVPAARRLARPGRSVRRARTDLRVLTPGQGISSQSDPIAATRPRASSQLPSLVRPLRLSSITIPHRISASPYTPTTSTDDRLAIRSARTTAIAAMPTDDRAMRSRLAWRGVSFRSPASSAVSGSVSSTASGSSPGAGIGCRRPGPGQKCS